MIFFKYVNNKIRFADTQNRIEADLTLNYYNNHKEDIWIGHGARRKDIYYLAAFIQGKNLNLLDKHFAAGKAGWRFFSRYIVPVKCFDLEQCCMPLEYDMELRNLDNPLECMVELFLEHKDKFKTQLDLCGNPYDLIKTKSQLVAKCLNAKFKKYKDSDDLHLPRPKLKNDIREKLLKMEQFSVKLQDIDISFGNGGIHGAKNKYAAKGCFWHLDVVSMYPSIMYYYHLLSRSADFNKFKQIYEERLKNKGLKLYVNCIYGSMKDRYNPLYDPRNANNICALGQLIMWWFLEQIDKFGLEIINVNTDGVIIKMPDDWLNVADAIQCYDSIVDYLIKEFEKKTSLKLTKKQCYRLFQRDVNCYIEDNDFIGRKRDMRIIDNAVLNYLVEGINLEETISKAPINDYVRVPYSKNGFLLNGEKINKNYFRVIAGRNGKILRTGKGHKIANCPERVGNIPDKFWYINEAKRRANEFI